MYPGFDLVRYGTMTDTVTTAVKEEFIAHGFPKRREHATPCRAIWGSPGSVRRQKELRKSMGQGLYCGFQEKEQARWGRQAK